MKNSYYKSAVFITLCFTVFSTFAVETVYVGQLSLGKSSSITHLVEVEHANKKNINNLPSQSELIAALSQGSTEKRLKKNKTLRLSPAKPYNLLLVNTSKSENTITEIDQDVSQSFYQFEHSQWYVYVKNTADGASLKAYNANTEQSISIAEMPLDYQTFKITQTGHVVTTNGKNLYHTQLILRGEHIQANNKWQQIKMPTNTISGRIAEISISHFGNKIAIKSAY